MKLKPDSLHTLLNYQTQLYMGIGVSIEETRMKNALVWIMILNMISTQWLIVAGDWSIAVTAFIPAYSYSYSFRVYSIQDYMYLLALDVV